MSTFLVFDFANIAHLKFVNADEKCFCLHLSKEDEWKNLSLNETLDNHSERTDYYHYERWLNFILSDRGKFTFRYRICEIIDNKLIVTNDDNEVHYYGFKTAVFDLEEVRKITRNAILSLDEKQTNFTHIDASKYQIFVKKGNLILIHNGSKKTLLANIKHYRGIGIKQINECLKQHSFVIKFRNCGPYKLSIEKVNNSYIFTSDNAEKISLEESQNLLMALEDMASILEQK